MFQQHCKVEDILTLEACRWDHVLKAQQFFRNHWLPAFRAIKQCGMACATINKDHRIYRYDCCYDGSGVIFDSEHNKNERCRNRAVAIQFSKVEDRNNVLDDQVGKSTEALLSAIRNFFFRHKPLLPKDSGELLVMQINGRQYHFVGKYNRCDVLVWEPYIMPENGIRVLEYDPKNTNPKTRELMVVRYEL